MFIDLDKCIKCGSSRYVPIFSLHKITPIHQCIAGEDFDANSPFDALTNYFQYKFEKENNNLPDIYYDLVSTLEMTMDCYNDSDFNGALYYLAVLVSLIKNSVISDVNLIRAIPEVPEDLNER